MTKISKTVFNLSHFREKRVYISFMLCLMIFFTGCATGIKIIEEADVSLEEDTDFSPAIFYDKIMQGQLETGIDGNIIADVFEEYGLAEFVSDRFDGESEFLDEMRGNAYCEASLTEQEFGNNKAAIVFTKIGFVYMYTIFSEINKQWA